MPCVSVTDDMAFDDMRFLLRGRYLLNRHLKLGAWTMQKFVATVGEIRLLQHHETKDKEGTKATAFAVITASIAI